MEFPHNIREQFAEAVALTVYKTGTAAEIVEKDYYVDDPTVRTAVLCVKESTTVLPDEIKAAITKTIR